MAAEGEAIDRPVHKRRTLLNNQSKDPNLDMGALAALEQVFQHAMHTHVSQSVSSELCGVKTPDDKRSFSPTSLR